DLPSAIQQSFELSEFFGNSLRIERIFALGDALLDCLDANHVYFGRAIDALFDQLQTLGFDAGVIAAVEPIDGFLASGRRSGHALSARSTNDATVEARPVVDRVGHDRLLSDFANP